MKTKTVLLGHGSGGRLSHELIKNLFIKYFDNPVLNQQGDSALLKLENENVAFTTDSYVIDPIFFNGGNIGKLAVCGTVNDVAVSGAIPKYLSAAFIIEEGLPLDDLEKIVVSMAEEAKKAGVIIVTGDTKVVDKNKCDKLFINTAGIGVIDEKFKHISSGKNIETGDHILINGTIADHGMSVMAARNFESFRTDIKSDCACLNHFIKDILDSGSRVKFIRDATRGGIASVLCEIAEGHSKGIEIDELNVPISENVNGLCEILGFDPFYVANEGKIIVVVHPDDSQKVIDAMQKSEFGKNAAIIGKVVEDHPGKAILITEIGGKRIIDMLAGEQLPRIC
jgi:hydrogenase expression/formation protein HypE